MNPAVVHEKLHSILIFALEVPLIDALCVIVLTEGPNAALFSAMGYF